MTRYRSPLRERQAAETRRRVVEAAAEHFARHGYSATTLGTVATAAGVSVETVRSVGPKSTLLLAAFELAFTGDDDPSDVPFPAQPEIASLVATGDGRRMLDGIGRWLAGTNAGLADLWRTVAAAAVDDAEVDRRLALHDARLREGIRRLLGELVDRGVFAPAGSLDTVADLIWNAQTPDGYLRLVRRAGWSEEQYAAHLVDTLVGLCRPTDGTAAARDR